MVIADCPREGCDWRSLDLDAGLVGIYLTDHLATVHPRLAPPKAPKLPQPKVRARIQEDLWESFQKEWERYKAASNITENANVFLLNCCESDLKENVLRETPDIITKTEAVVLETIKKHAVLTIATSVLATELFSMKQDHSEPVRSFAARQKGKARSCKLIQKCTNCDATVDFSDRVVKTVMLNGLCNEDVRKEVLGDSGLDEKSLEDTIKLVEAKEAALRSTGGANDDQSSGVTGYSKYKKIQATDKRLQEKGKCDSCKEEFLIHGVVRRPGKDDEIKRYKICKPCFDKRKKKVNKKEKNSDEEGAVTAGQFAFLGSVSSGIESKVMDRGVTGQIAMVKRGNTECAAVVLPNYVWEAGAGWIKRPNDPHPKIRLQAFIKESDYSEIGLRPPKMRQQEVIAVTDSGAMCNLIGWSLLQKFGLSKKDLCKVSGKWSAINGDSIDILGAVFIRLKGVDDISGKEVGSAIMAFVTESTNSLWIGQRTMKNMGIIDEDFPRLKATELNSRVAGMTASTAPCGCKVREKPPKRPDKLPFDPKEENVPKMREWLLRRFESSTFNKCTHERLTMMDSEPIRIHIDKNAKPVSVKQGKSVPLQWRDEVKEQLDQDVRLGILEKVPIGTPSKWLHRMHVVAKQDGRPRRTVDLRKLNDHCLRETQHVGTAYRNARTIPKNTWKSKTDCWNGYHSCPLHEDDRELTTFTTEWGRYRYKVAPQGFVAAGDGYNQRYDDLIDGVERKVKQVDDVALWDSDISEHWWRMLDYLEMVGNNGMVLNPEKFEFCQKEIEFAGFVVTETEVKPPKRILDSIREFPTPTNISDVRSWFGLVNQVGHYAKLGEVMRPFKDLLSPKTPFRWTQELDEAFIKSREAIVELIKEGVKIFDPTLTTMLSTDWSRTGIGYWLYQKVCDCPSLVTGCCEGGWRVTLAHSRFLSKAEENYWPTEGEALAVAWALEDSKFFTIGCRDLHIQTDHQPLVRLLGDKELDEIDNRRLVSFKERTFPWKFEIHWIEGKKIPAPDALSRHPVAGAIDMEEEIVIAASRACLEESRAVTWERVRAETERDVRLIKLIEMAKHGFPDDSKEMPDDLVRFWSRKDKLYVVDGVLMDGNRVVVPEKLRKEALMNLHGAHQGCSQMRLRAEYCIFWPGINADIENLRKSCLSCDVNAPSQPCMPSERPLVPDGPFQCVVSDYFSLKGHNYLVTADRFSNWPDVREAPAGTEAFGSRGMIKACRELFATFGVPEELSTDYGPQYKAHDLASFFKKWGVTHRTSSAHFPQSNGRAEVAVKGVKRMLRENMGEDGTLDTDAVMKGLLLMRNQPERDSGLSPAMVLMGRQLRDSLPLGPPLSRRSSVFDEDSPVSQSWRNMWKTKEIALSERLVKNMEKLNVGTKRLTPLKEGDRVRVQNQNGNSPLKWDRTGQVVQVGDHDQYIVRVDGSRRLTKRNRKFLRKFEKYEPSLSSPIREVPSTGHVMRERPADRVSIERPADHTSQTHREQGDIPPASPEGERNLRVEPTVHPENPEREPEEHRSEPEFDGPAVEEEAADQDRTPAQVENETQVQVEASAKKKLRLLTQLEDFNLKGDKEKLEEPVRRRLRERKNV